MELKTVPKRWVLLFIVVLSFLVYGNTFLNDWTYDDRPVVVENPDAQSIRGFLENSRPGRPLRELSYIPEHLIFRDKPAGYHFQQIGWHAANGFLLYILLTLLGLAPLHALAGVIFFLLHPLQAESIANISHRKEPLALFFGLSSLVLYVRIFSSEGRKWLLFFAGSVIAFILALLANETAVSLPILFLVYELLFVEKERRLFLKKPLLAAVVAVFAGAVIIYHYRWLFSVDQLWNIYSKNAFIASKSFFPFYMGALKTFGLYITKIIIPLQLAPEYVIHFSEDWLQPGAILSLIVLVMLVVLAVYLKKKNPAASFGIAAFLVLYAPVSNIVPASYMMADRYMYMPLVGAALLLASLVRHLPQKAVVASTVGLVSIFGYLTVVQNSHWRDEHSLWRHAVKVNPDSTWCQEAAAHSFMLKGELQQALYHARKAVELNRYNTRAYLTLGKIEEMNGNLENALKNYELFQSVGEVEFPEQVANIKAYLPILRERVQILNELRKG